MTEAPLILASGSAGRAAILRQAGLAFTQIVSDVDEAEIKTRLLAEGHGLDDLALALATAKARAVSRRHEGLVIGADQILGLDGRGFEKPRDLAEAASHLRRFAGRAHQLHTALVVMDRDEVVFSHVSTPVLTMRPLREAEISAYLAATGDKVLATVGAYQLEAEGARLFERIDGTTFDIIGLPLLPLLAFLRPHLDLEY